jgi:putative ABC transport system permease protein
MAQISPRDIEYGRMFTAEEEQRAAHVVLIGPNVADSLFPAGDALGKPVMVGGAEYTVIGVWSKAKGGFFGENGLDNSITMPFRTAQFRYPQIDRYMITAKARPGLREQALDEMEGAMRRIRRLATDQPDDFSLSTPDQIIQQFDKITGLIGLVAIAISGLGLLVGGIGVMNIMLVSVTERTREIGIRKSVGAQSGDVLLQVLIEAVIMSCSGGLLGVGIGAALTEALGRAFELSMHITAGYVTLALVVSSVVGIVSGWYPAYRASRLDPVVALRAE